jgi:5-hmdU DNA kinase, helical domain
MEHGTASLRGFFTYARRRHEVFLRRAQSLPPPWTSDPILQSYRFTNIFREDDRTTAWFRQHVRERYNGTPEVLPATVVFRWFNKIETGEAMFEGPSFAHGNPFEAWLHHGDTGILREAIVHARGAGPYVNGAYIIKSPAGMSKLDGVLQSCERFRTNWARSAWDWRHAAVAMESCDWNLETSWDWLREHDQLGDFMSYEIVTDLRHTHLLSDAPDIMTWANAGPGAKRGLNRLRGRPLDQTLPKAETCAEMREILRASTSPFCWPQAWGRWEMREVEHTLCEFDKYERARLGEGTPKQRYAGEG